MTFENYTSKLNQYVREVDFEFEPDNAGFDLAEYMNSFRQHQFDKPAKTRKSELTQEVASLYDAASFLIWERGLCFNASITLNARKLGFTHPVEFAAAITDYNKEMHRCLFDGEAKQAKMKVQQKPQIRISRRSRELVEHPHYWMSVIEHARDQGVHAHLLCVVPKPAVNAFKEKTLTWWMKHCPGSMQADAIHFRIEHSSVWERKVGLQQRLFRYIIKTTAEGLRRRDHEGREWTARQIFKPAPNECTPVYIEINQMAQISHRLNHDAQDRVDFVSRFRARRFDEVYTAWERQLSNRWARERAQRIGSLTI